MAAAAHLLHRVGRAVTTCVRRGREAHGLILMYHRIAEAASDPWRLCVSPDNFEAHLAVLRRHADVVPLEDLPSSLRRGRRGRPVVAITFDDGYLDNLTAAKPRLAVHDMPATVFVASGWIGTPEPFWWDRLAAMVGRLERLPPFLELADVVGTFRWQRENQSESVARNDLLGSLWRMLRDVDHTTRHRILNALADRLGTALADPKDARAMTRDELRELTAGGLMTLGAHTASHCSLPTLSPALQRAEIEHSARACAQITGARPRAFAYPFGDWSAASREAVGDAGFTLACSTTPDLVWSGDDPLVMPRIQVGNCRGGQFLLRLRYLWLP